MKAIILSALSSLAAAQLQGSGITYGPSGAYGPYPKGWVDFNGGDTSPVGLAMAKSVGNLLPPNTKHPQGGTGPYKAAPIEDPTLKNQTIYVPKELPSGKKLPLVVWGNGGCFASGQFHGNILTDIASHGYIVIASGQKDPKTVAISKNTEMFDAAMWAADSKNTQKYNIDINSVASAGHSCGGMQAYTGNQIPGIKTTIVMNSGLLASPNLLRPKLDATLKANVLYLEGGSRDAGYANVSD
jgi:hypothetical protein